MPLVIRAAALALALAACSSPSTTTHTTPPIDDNVIVAVAVDAAVAAPVAELVPDAEPFRPCLSRRAEPRGIEGDALLMCVPEESCSWLAPDGAITDAPMPASVPAVIVDEDKVAAWVPAPDHLVGTAIDAEGARIALVAEEVVEKPKYLESVGVYLEVWDRAKSKRLAHAKVPGLAEFSGHLDLAYLGDTLLLVVDDAGDEAVIGSLWRVAGKKLKRLTSLVGNLKTWTLIDAKRAAVLLDEDVRVVELTSGKLLAKLDWRAALPEDEREFFYGPSLQLATVGGAPVVDVQDNGDGSRHLIVFTADGDTAPKTYVPEDSCGGGSPTPRG